MVENLYNFEKVLKHISVNEDIFKPNLTTKLSIEAAQDELKNNFSILDLGCGSGVIGIALMKNFPSIEMHCSDVDENAIKNKKNFKSNNLKADIRSGNLFEPWKEKNLTTLLMMFQQFLD